MRKFVTAAVSSLAAAALLFTAGVRTSYACDHDKKKVEEKSEKKLPAHLMTASFKVEGMTCDGCADKVKTGLASRDGIVKVEVATAEHRLTVQYDGDKLDTGKIAKIIAELGYKATAEA